MDKLLTERNLLMGLTIALKVNVICFFASVLISIGWTYILTSFWDFDYLLYLCIFYCVNISMTLLIKKWYKTYLQRRENLACPMP